MCPVGAASVKRRAVGELLISRSFGIGGGRASAPAAGSQWPGPALILPTRGDWVWDARTLPHAQLPGVSASTDVGRSIWHDPAWVIRRPQKKKRPIGSLHDVGAWLRLLPRGPDRSGAVAWTTLAM